MVIEVVSWPNAPKTHVKNQDNPRFTLCGVWIRSDATIREAFEDEDEFPTCLRCSASVMKS